MKSNPKETAAEPPEGPARARHEDPPAAFPGPEDSASDQLRSGKLFACFELERELEIGSTGTIWLAQNYGVKRQADQVTLKFLPKAIVENETALEDLKDQIRRRIPLHHPNIQRVYDLVESKGKVAVQLEYVDGQSLSHLRLAKPNQVFEVRDLAKWAAELCGALEYVHQEAGLTNIKIVPGNLIIDGAGNLKVKDVGITDCIADSMNRLMARDESGTAPAYQSQQQAAGKKPAATDDLDSLGALLYELLTSQPPFGSAATGAQAGEKLPPSMSRRRAELGIVGEAIPESWEETVAACLAKDPSRRPQSASEVEKRLKSTSDSTPNPQSPVGTQSARKKRLPGMALILVLAAGSVFVFLALHPSTEPKRINPVIKSSPALPSSPSKLAATENLLSERARSPEGPTPAPAASPATSPAARPASSPGLSPKISEEVRPSLPPKASSPISSALSPTPPLEETPTISPPETAMPGGQSAGSSPALTRQHDIDATREDVIKRINALPGVNAEKKTNLIEKMRKARWMERLTVIPFDASQVTLRRTAVDDLLKAFALPEMRDKLSDPTTILVVAGYADTGGRAEINLRISQERAENISRILKQQAKLPNAIQTIGMGGTELLDSQRPGENRAVEVWAVVPF